MSSLSQNIVAEVRALIADGSIQPGEKLPTESAMMERYSVSRTVVREAISRLQAIGLVESYRGKGSYVIARPSDEPFSVEPSGIRTIHDRLQLIDFRLGCEVGASALAAVRRTPTQLKHVMTALARFSSNLDRLSAAVDADFQLHRSIAIASNNRYYVQLLDSLGPTMIALPQTRLSPAAQSGEVAHLDRVEFEHESIVSAIERQDAQAAAAAMRVHLASSRDRLLAHRP